MSRYDIPATPSAELLVAQSAVFANYVLRHHFNLAAPPLRNHFNLAGYVDSTFSLANGPSCLCIPMRDLKITIVPVTVGNPSLDPVSYVAWLMSEDDLPALEQCDTIYDVCESFPLRPVSSNPTQDAAAQFAEHVFEAWDDFVLKLPSSKILD